MSQNHCCSRDTFLLRRVERVEHKVRDSDAAIGHAVIHVDARATPLHRRAKPKQNAPTERDGHSLAADAPALQ